MTSAGPEKTWPFLGGHPHTRLRQRGRGVNQASPDTDAHKQQVTTVVTETVAFVASPFPYAYLPSPGGRTVSCLHPKDAISSYGLGLQTDSRSLVNGPQKARFFSDLQATLPAQLTRRGRVRRAS